jgi:AraC-like DNA-binding protein
MIHDRTGLEGAANAYLRHCFRRESVPHVHELARMVGLTPSQFARHFKDATSHRAGDYLKLRQIRRAKALLARTSLTTTEIAYRSAYQTRAAFYRAFRDRAGVTPGAYRRACKKRH